MKLECDYERSAPVLAAPCTHPRWPNPIKLRRSGMNRAWTCRMGGSIRANTTTCHLRSLAGCWARAAINMSLLTELDPLFRAALTMNVAVAGDGHTPLSARLPAASELALVVRHHACSSIFRMARRRSAAGFGCVARRHSVPAFRRVATGINARSAAVAAAEKPCRRQTHQTRRPLANGPEIPLAHWRAGNTRGDWQGAGAWKDSRAANQLRRWRGG